MAGVNETIGMITTLKESGKQLSRACAHYGSELDKASRYIAQLMQGSRTGDKAVGSMTVAAASVKDTVSSLDALDKDFDRCIEQMRS